MQNLDIRLKMMEMGVKQWQILEVLGISQATLTRRLRTELPSSEKKRWIAAIEQVAAAKR